VLCFASCLVCGVVFCEALCVVDGVMFRAELVVWCAMWHRCVLCHIGLGLVLCIMYFFCVCYVFLRVGMMWGLLCCAWVFVLA